MLSSTPLRGMLLLLSCSVSAFEVIGNSAGCTGGGNPDSNGSIKKVLGPDEGCQRLDDGSNYSATLKSTGSVDDNFYVQFFSSTDCNFDTRIGRGDAYGSESSCVEVDSAVKSYRVLDVCEEGHEDCLSLV